MVKPVVGSLLWRLRAFHLDPGGSAVRLEAAKRIEYLETVMRDALHCFYLDKRGLERCDETKIKDIMIAAIGAEVRCGR